MLPSKSAGNGALMFFVLQTALLCFLGYSIARLRVLGAPLYIIFSSV